jgi:hypothetical protein
MFYKKSNLYKYFFLSIIGLMTVFNGGYNNLYIQFNFIIISIYFLIFINNKNYLAHVKKIFWKNKIAIYLYSLFILFLTFQTIPLPVEWLKFLSPEKYNFLEMLEFSESFNSISLNPINSYFSILNYIALFLYLIIFKSLFYKISDIFKLYYFLVCLGGIAACVAIYFYLIGNPDFLILKNNAYKNSATGFFVNRTVFSCYLVLCFFCGIEYLKTIDYYQKDNTSNFFKKIYVRIFLLLITIGIITSFSKLGNFLFISLIIIYSLKEFYLNDKKKRFFLITLLLIVLFDVLILGFYFGSEKLLQRYSFLQNEINEYLPSIDQQSLSRGDLSKFALIEFQKFALFGYGEGGFEYLLKIKFDNLSTSYASSAHSDLLQFIGEFGIIGSTLIFLSILFIHIKNSIFSYKNFILYYLLIFILIFDFSFSIPVIQFLFILLLSVKYRKSNNFEYQLKD